MQIFENFDIKQDKYSVVTIGNFDGIHLGHKKLITETKKIAKEKNLISILISFKTHPVEVLQNKKFSYIFTQQEKIFLLEKEGIDIFLNYDFNKDFASLLPEQFIEIIYKKLNCKYLVVGEDYCFGRNRTGNVEILKEIAKKYNISVIKINDIIIDGERVSSTSIRKCLLEKNIKKANILLNRNYFIYGKVIKGNMLGRTIGFPTANIIPLENKILPPDAVYITKTLIGEKIYQSITNIGKNPTINANKRTIETYIFDFNQDIYGKEIIVMFLDWVRDVKKFANLEELKNQIAKDINITNQYFKINKI